MKRGAALAGYAGGRRTHTGQIIERAKARGEIAGDIDPGVVADLVASYAWRHLLINRLDEPEATIRKMVRYLLQGIEAPGR